MSEGKYRRRHRSVACVTLALAAASVVRAAAPAAPEAPDMVLLNGTVLSVDANDTVYEALAIKGERIAAVGSSRDIAALAGRNTNRIDLKGRTVTPRTARYPSASDHGFRAGSV
ncbi:MAG: hypothetical protein WDO68_26305 [Gammaproteobacteria bacterium]